MYKEGWDTPVRQIDVWFPFEIISKLVEADRKIPTFASLSAIHFTGDGDGTNLSSGLRITNMNI